MKNIKLRMTGHAHNQFKGHLFPGDGLEAVAFALCGFLETESDIVYTVHSVYLYPHDQCTVREGDRVEWSPSEIVDLFESSRKKGFRLLKIHSHPEYWPYFSKVDDRSDIELADTVSGWVGKNESICSVILLPDGSMIGRSIDHNGNFTKLTSILVISENISCFYDKEVNEEDENYLEIHDAICLRTKQAFGEGTTSILQKLRIGVVGCSGTGSIVAEQLARLCVGSLVLVDHDKVETKNVNRILNSKTVHAQDEVYKVDMMKQAIDSIGIDVQVQAIAADLHSMDAYMAIASCDIVFGCMDTVDGRYLLNRISTYFCSAYFDIGVRLDADGKGGINEIQGRVDYIQPGLSSLLTRERYTLNQLKEADLARTNPDEHKRQIKEGYIKSANVGNPAVISVNMMFSSMAVTELLARLHPFRDRGSENYAAITFSVSGFLLIAEREAKVDEELSTKVGLGHKLPILDAPMLVIPSIKVSYEFKMANSLAVS